MTTPPLETEADARNLPSVRAVYAIEGYGDQWRTSRRAATRAITAQACDEAGITPGAYEARFLDGMAEWEPERNGTLANLLTRFYEAGKAARDGEAADLLERVLFLRQNGERPPGAPRDDLTAETWQPLDRDVETYLRRIRGM